jgi:hypothetical protein
MAENQNLSPSIFLDRTLLQEVFHDDPTPVSETEHVAALRTFQNEKYRTAFNDDFGVVGQGHPTPRNNPQAEAATKIEGFIGNTDVNNRSVFHLALKILVPNTLT